jgi:hypothetical protein
LLFVKVGRTLSLRRDLMTRIAVLVATVLFGAQFANAQDAECLQDASYGSLEPNPDPQRQGLGRARQLGFLPTDWRELYNLEDGTHIRADRFRRNPNECGTLEAAGDVVVMVREGGTEVTIRTENLSVDWNCVPQAGFRLFDSTQFRDVLWAIDGYCLEAGDPAVASAGNRLSVDETIEVAARTLSLDSQTGGVSAEGEVTIVVTRPDGYTITMHAERVTIERALVDRRARGWADVEG